MRIRPWKLLLSLLATAAVVVSGWVPVANAAASGGITLASSTVAPGGSTTFVTALTASPALPSSTTVSITVAPVPPATGTVTLSNAVPGPDFLPFCDPVSAVQFDCLWQTGSTAGSVEVTATASADASGAFVITATVTGSGVVATQTLTVLAPTPSTTTPPTTPSTTAPPTTTPAVIAPATTLSPSVTIPATGRSTDGLMAAALATLAAGLIIVAFARRPRRV